MAAIEAIKENIIDGDNLKSGALDVLAQHILGVACCNPFDKTELYENVKRSKSDVFVMLGAGDIAEKVNTIKKLIKKNGL